MALDNIDFSNLTNRALSFIASPGGTGALLYCGCFVGLGLTLSVLGPVLLDLAVQTDSTLTAVGFCVVARSLGYLLGSTGGQLYDWLPGHYVLSFAMFSSALGSMLIPSATVYGGLIVLVIFQGIGMGLCDTGCNVCLIFWFGKDVGPIMQTLHFAFAAGASCGPFLLRLVASLSGDDAIVDKVGGAVGQGNYDAAFYIIAAYNILLGILLVLKKSPMPRTTGSAPKTDASSENQLAITSTSSPSASQTSNIATRVHNLADPSKSIEAEEVNIDGEVKQSSQVDKIDAWGASGRAAVDKIIPSSTSSSSVAIKDDEHNKTEGDEVYVPPELQKDLWIVSGVVALLLGIYVGCETGYGAFVTSYMVVELQQSEGSAQLLAGAYWAAICLGRFLSIFVAMRFAPRDYLGASMAGCCAAAILMFATCKIPAGMWVSGVIYGFFMACVFPTGIAYAETVFPVQGKHITVFVIGSATGEMALPSLISLLFGGEVDAMGNVSRSSSGPGPIIMIYIVCIATFVNMLVYYLLVKLGESLRGKIEQAASAAARLQIQK
jgi:FHS family Na+ dependent glucose MFS transporter 1